MALSNPLDILLAHNHWATRNVLDACVKLSSEQFHRRFEIGPGSLHDALTHVIGAMDYWSHVAAERPVVEFDDKKRREPVDLLMLLDAVGADLALTASTRPLDRVVTRVRMGKTESFTRGGILTHVTTHGVHHRAQCVNMLRHLGVSPLPEVYVIGWMRAEDPVR